MSTRTLEELGAALYGSPVPSVSADAPTRPRTEEELGEALYGRTGTMRPEKTADSERTVATAEQATPTKPRTTEELGEALYAKEIEDEALDPVSQEVAELRDEPARRMYSAQISLRDAIPEHEFVNAEGVGEKAGRKAVRELRELV